MTDKKVWFVTGAGRGMGVNIARAALAAGNAVVATGRNTDTVTKALGKADDLLVVKLDITNPERSIEDYAERHAARREWYAAQNGRQSGDPARLAQALIMIAGQEQPPRRFIAGADAIAIAEQKVADLQAQINTFRELSTSL